MTTYSHSRLSTFEQCRYKYKLSYIDKIKVDVPTTIEAFMGDMVHQTLEKLYTDLKFQKLNSLKDLLVFYNEIWEKEFSEDILIAKEGYFADNYKHMGEKYITDYYNQYAPFDDMIILGLETEEQMEIADGIKYHVRIDKLGCIKNVYYVCDYKTNIHMKTQEDADMDRQLAMYSIWVKDKFKDAKKVILKWHMLAFNKEVTSERTLEQLQELQDDVLKLIHEIEECKDYPTNVTNLCNYCVYKNICPSFKHEEEIKDKKPRQFKADDGVKLVDKYAKFQLQKKEAEEELEELKEKLIAFAEQKGIDIIYGSNKKASVKEYTKIVFPEDKEGIIALIKKKGLYEEFSNINYLKLGPKILKGEIDKEIQKLTTTEKDHRISISNKKLKED